MDLLDARKRRRRKRSPDKDAAQVCYTLLLLLLYICHNEIQSNYKQFRIDELIY